MLQYRTLTPQYAVLGGITIDNPGGILVYDPVADTKLIELGHQPNITGDPPVTKRFKITFLLFQTLQGVL